MPYALKSLGQSYLETYVCCLCLKKNIQGEITQEFKRYVKTNNKFVRVQWNPDEASKYLQHLYAKSLYRWAMIQQLPVFVFAWNKLEDFTSDKRHNLVKTDKEVYILEVDVDYPKDL